ncbi:MAG: hypothetical protein KC419_03050 [Anaerolineales bacterium]|nr:hypothetical protein [Anaerolineales bacterium]
MNWEEIRTLYPKQWLLVEATKAYSESSKRILEQLQVLQSFADSTSAMKQYSQIHRQQPQREMYVLHTDRAELDISERRWIGIRGI